ncbi:MAG: GNAT family N-acetyltransferase [Acidobacteriaceae bacterium]
MPELEEIRKAALVSRPLAHNLQLLDNPIWNALTTEHNALALAEGQARRYPAEIGPLSGLAEQTAEAYESLRALTGTGPGGFSAQFLQEPPLDRPGWSLIREGLMSQMIWSGDAPPSITPPSAPVVLRHLTRADVPAMVELAELTEPGPFRARTCELGEFFGILEAGQLLAMAGQRIRLPGFVEVSAVCTHPDARGRGYARTLMSEVIADILGRGAWPMLHVLADNHSAIRVYEALGFAHRIGLHLAVLQAE